MTAKPASVQHRVLVYGRGISLPAFWVPLQRWVGSLAPSDHGADQVHPSIRHNLHWFRLVGAVGQVGESIVLTYLSLFVLALGATRAQIGLMSALSNLSAALLLLPGAFIVERWGRRKQLCMLGAGGGAPVALLLLALIPLAVSGPAAVYIAIALVAARSAFIHLVVPAWVSITADIVPIARRGRYFASRNIAMAVTGTVATFLVGLFITHTASPVGFQLALGIAFIAGLASTFSFGRIRDDPIPAARSSADRGSQLPLLRHLRAHPEFLVFSAVAALWNCSLNIGGPFFNIYMVEELKASASTVGVLGVIVTLSALPGQRLFGILADRWGPRRIQLITGLIIPIVPLGWALSRSPWHLVPVQVAVGFLWAGYALASYNFLLVFTPEDRRSHYTALYQIAVTIGLASGAALGGIIATRWGYESVFNAARSSKRSRYIDHQASLTKRRIRMRTVFCIDCERPIRLEFRPVEGEIITCSNCGAQLEVISLEPVELDWAYLNLWRGRKLGHVVTTARKLTRPFPPGTGWSDVIFDQRVSAQENPYTLCRICKR